MANDAIDVLAAVPTFLVSDVAATAQWYDEQLGFRTVGTVPEVKPYYYASLRRGQAELMLLSVDGYHKPGLLTPRRGGHWDAYVRMNGVHALHDALSEKPFITTPLTQRPYGDWEFEVRDPNDYVIVFGGAY